MLSFALKKKKKKTFLAVKREIDKKANFSFVINAVL